MQTYQRIFDRCIFMPAKMSFLQSIQTRNLFVQNVEVTAQIPMSAMLVIVIGKYMDFFEILGNDVTSFSWIVLQLIQYHKTFSNLSIFNF